MRNNTDFYLLAVFLVFLVGLTSIVTFNYQSPITARVTNEPHVVTVVYPGKISFEDYLNNPQDYDGRYADVVGFLYRELSGTETAGTYYEYVIDHYGNKIRLLSLKPSHFELFPRIGQARGLYKVSGKFTKDYHGLHLIVADIEKAEVLEEPEPEEELEGISVEEDALLDEIEEKPPSNNWFSRLIRAVRNVFAGKCIDGTLDGECSNKKPYYCENSKLVKNPELCSCPGGERLYQKECIEIITCSDGTLHPECSPSNRQCLDGELVFNVELCGVPEGYILVGDTLLRKCSDGTFPGRCSTAMRYFCEDGELIEKASLCGCPSSYFIQGDTCVAISSLVEEELYRLINLERKIKGLPELEKDETLENIAWEHTREMAYSNYFSHTNIAGESPTDRAVRQGYNIRKEIRSGVYQTIIGENIGKIEAKTVENDPETIAATQVGKWVIPPSKERSNVYNEHYTHAGIGVIYKDGWYITTMVFW